MDPIIPAFAVTAAVFAAYEITRRQYLRRHVERMAGLEIGNLYLTRIRGFSWMRGGSVFRAREGPLEVLIARSVLKKNAQVRVLIPGPPGFSEVSIRRERQIPWKTREIEVGSESFDETFFVAGPIPLVLALLDKGTRSLLIRANEAITGIGSRLEIGSGELVAEMAYRQLADILPLLLRIGERLTHPGNVKQRLVQNATRDPEARVRMQNLLVLAREFPGDPEVRKVLRAACSDPSPEVRLRAGKALGTEGLPVLVKLTENLEDDTVSAEAVSMLGRELPSKRIRDVLRHALSKPFPQTARACMVALSRDGDAFVDVLAKVLEHEHEGLAVFAAEVLQTIASPKAEGPLILALQRDQPALRLAVANALGRVGSPAAVLPLKEAAERFSRDLALSQATYHAIAGIKARLPDATPGQLSLAGAEAGQLSLAEAEAGQLSIATDPEGQLSISDAEDKKRES